MDDSAIVSIVRCATYGPAEVQAAVEELLDLAELTPVMQGAGTALIKPNLLSARKPEDAVTTHPAVISAVGRVAARCGRSLSIGDSPPFAGERHNSYLRHCTVTGVTATADELGAQLVRFEDAVAEVEYPEGVYLRRLEFARAVLETDLLINVCKLKTHGATVLTGAVKNVFGCVPGVRKGLFHVQAGDDRAAFAEMLVDLAAALRPAVNVMDAVVAMDGEGPNAGRPRPLGLLIASSDPVALDAVASAVVGLDPMSVDTTRLAHERGVGCGDLGRVEIRGEAIDAVAVDGFRLSSGVSQWDRFPAFLRKLFRSQLVAVPYVSADECSGCGDCVEACPVDAIQPGRPASIDLGKCIRCYCCHEVCNFSAARLTQGWLGVLLRRAATKR